jgi:hypothetical protein
MPKPNPNENKEEYVSRFMSSEEAQKSFPDKKQRLAVAYSKWKENHKMKEMFCLRGLSIKEENGEIILTGLLATTHPDRVGDILSKKAINQIIEHINDTSKAGGDVGSYRGV